LRRPKDLRADGQGPTLRFFGWNWSKFGLIWPVPGLRWPKFNGGPLGKTPKKGILLGKES